MEMKMYFLLLVLLVLVEKSQSITNSSLSECNRNVVYHVQALHQDTCCNNSANSGAGVIEDLRSQLAALQVKLDQKTGNLENRVTVLEKMTTPASSCADGYTASLGSTCYKFVTSQVNWYQAQIDCQADDARLVVIESEQEQTYLQNHINSQAHLKTSGGFWTALTDLAASGVWTWMGPGRRLSYSAWGSGEPNGASEHCVHLTKSRNWKWNDITCGYKMGFICEKRKQ